MFDQNGEVASTRIVYDNRLLTWLLARLHPERYGTRVPAAPDAAPATPPTTALIESLRAMEPALPAPAEQLLAPDALAGELDLAEMADGELPHFLREQPPVRSAAQEAAAAAHERSARGAAALERQKAGEQLTDEEFADLCFHLDPEANARRRKPAR